MALDGARAGAGAALAVTVPRDKARAARQLWQALRRDELTNDADAALEPVPVGRPARPRLVHPGQVPRRRIGSPAGHGALLHAVAHIEFNAINLALDAAHRFAGMPFSYYADWIRVASEEAHHFSLVRTYLEELGFAYGDFDAHNGLWAMAERTAGDPLVRMALVPRVLEARGLDVTPQMRSRLESIDDRRGVAILDVIARDEVGHVAVGSRWFQWCCETRGLPPEATFLELIRTELPTPPKPPFATAARLQGGFSDTELRELEALDAARRKQR